MGFNSPCKRLVKWGVLILGSTYEMGFNSPCKRLVKWGVLILGSTYEMGFNSPCKRLVKWGGCLFWRVLMRWGSIRHVHVS